MISNTRQDRNSAAADSVDREVSHLRFAKRDTCEILGACWPPDTRCCLSQRDPADRRFALPPLVAPVDRGSSTFDRERLHPERRVTWRNFPACHTSASCRRVIADELKPPFRVKALAVPPSALPELVQRH